jgi:twinkle protein
MKVKSSITGSIYDVDIRRAGQSKIICPECSHTRRHTKDRSLSFNSKNGIGHCHHCNASFFEYRPYIEKKQYVIPEWKNRTELSDKAVKWFNGRMISQETLNKMQISSAMEYMPQVEKETTVICFPYYYREKLVNIKFRDGAKNFKMVKDAELVFYNLNSILDQKECVVVEGEIDVLSFIEAGICNVISVPNGASGRTMEYVDNCYNELQGIEIFYIAVDNDPAGVALKDELVRRFGTEKCRIVNFKDCKDANDYLIKHGSVELRELLASATELPIKDIVNFEEIYDSVYSLYQNGLQPGLKINDPEFDKLLTWERGRLYLVSGIPSHGKSSFVDFLAVKLNIIHGWKSAYFSPENFPIQVHFAGIASLISGKRFNTADIPQSEFESIYSHIINNFFFIYPEDDITIENILEKATYLVKRKGIKVLVIDPYNKLEHTRNRNESETEYISRFLDALSMFAKKNDCVVVLVAHPTKMQKEKDEEKYKVPTLYDVSGSSHFFNKADFGIIVYRDFIEKKITVYVQKVKFKHLGHVGEVEYMYNLVNGRFYEHNGNPDHGTYMGRDWSVKENKSIRYNPNEYIEPESVIPF